MIKLYSCHKQSLWQVFCESCVNFRLFVLYIRIVVYLRTTDFCGVPFAKKKNDQVTTYCSKNSHNIVRGVRKVQPSRAWVYCIFAGNSPHCCKILSALVSKLFPVPAPHRGAAGGWSVPIASGVRPRWVGWCEQGGEIFVSGRQTGLAESDGKYFIFH